jgi:hypothetical protein
MAELIFEILRKASLSLLLISVLGYIFPETIEFGENGLQAGLVLSFFLYSGIVLFSGSIDKLFHVISIPVFTQFLQLFQKYAFTAGANSFWRLFPFITVDLYLIYFFTVKSPALSLGQKLLLVSWVLVNTLFIMISPNLYRIVWGGFTLFIITLPLYFCYLRLAAQAIDFRIQIEKYLCLIFLILGLGTFGLAIAGTAYKGSDNLLVTRNITDTNVTMAYFILLWPFVLLYCHRSNLPQLIRLIYFAIFSGIVIISFSRGAIFIIVPYLILSIVVARNFIHAKWLIILIIVVSAFSTTISTLWNNQELAYFWKLRFGDILSADGLSRIQQTSGRAEIHEMAYALFLTSPVIGHGTGSFEILGPGYREAHSLLFTQLAEQGLTGSIYLYGILLLLGWSLLSTVKKGRIYTLLPISFAFYMIFNHTVGSVFVIIPAKSITVNCIAPILLTCLYFYGRALCDYSQDKP